MGSAQRIPTPARVRRYPRGRRWIVEILPHGPLSHAGLRAAWWASAACRWRRSCYGWPRFRSSTICTTFAAPPPRDRTKRSPSRQRVTALLQSVVQVVDLPHSLWSVPDDKLGRLFIHTETRERRAAGPAHVVQRERRPVLHGSPEPSQCRAGAVESLALIPPSQYRAGASSADAPPGNLKGG